MLYVFNPRRVQFVLYTRSFSISMVKCYYIIFICAKNIKQMIKLTTAIVEFSCIHSKRSDWIHSSNISFNEFESTRCTRTSRRLSLYRKNCSPKNLQKRKFRINWISLRSGYRRCFVGDYSPWPLVPTSYSPTKNYIRHALSPYKALLYGMRR